MTFTLEVTNLSGTDTATGVGVIDDLPVGLTYVSDTCGGSLAGSQWTWVLGDLAAGASASCDLVTTVDAGATGSLVNQAVVDPEGADPTPANNTATATIQLQAPRVPVSGPWGLALLAALMVGAAVVLLRRLT